MQRLVGVEVLFGQIRCALHDPPPSSADEPGWEPPQHGSGGGTVIQQPKCFMVYSGELLIGVLSEIAHAPNAEQWMWALSGTRPNPPDFIWRGHERTLDEARSAHATCWAEWLRWAGLEQKQPTRWRSA